MEKHASVIAHLAPAATHRARHLLHLHSYAFANAGVAPHGNLQFHGYHGNWRFRRILCRTLVRHACRYCQAGRNFGCPPSYRTPFLCMSLRSRFSSSASDFLPMAREFQTALVLPVLHVLPKSEWFIVGIARSERLHVWNERRKVAYRTNTKVGAYIDTQ